jgi:putative flavoprotein involved in K+ transport
MGRSADLAGTDLAGTDLAGTDVDVAVIGAGQAGLSASRCLIDRGIEHVVLEAKSVVWEWQHRRWDSFSLVTPNWQCQLPGWPYQGSDPDGFMVLSDVIEYLAGYVASFDPPVHEGVKVRKLQATLDGSFRLDTTSGIMHARQVIIATGPYNVAVTPRIAAELPAGITHVHSGDYRNPDALPAGEVLVIGTGQSGCQIAEDLHLAGRRVHLATGSAPRVARRYRGRDVVRWLEDLGYYATTVADHPLGEEKRRNVNHYVTGRDGGRDIDLRAFATQGMALYGRLLGVDGETLRFGDDLTENLDRADAVAESIKDTIDAYIERQSIDAPHEDRYVPVWEPPPGPGRLDLGASDVATVIWCTGFRPDYSWIDLPVFDHAGRPRHSRGVTGTPGAYFLGLPWLHTWGSARFSGIAADAAYIADRAAERAVTVAASLGG